LKGLKTNKIAVAMSGGVDSSVVAVLLKQQGYEIAGFTMVQFDDDEFGYAKDEGSQAAVEDAKKICQMLEIEHFVIDVKDDFRKIVLNDFINQYKSGNTPNPCTLCNPTIKWGAFFDGIKEHGYEYMATGHYVKLIQGQDRPHVYRADNSKDQTYMLWALSKEQLAHTIFPLFELNKDQVREIAWQNNLFLADKKDSQEICFIKGHYLDFVNQIVPPKSGKIRFLATDEVIGKHHGLTAYTIGQRKGLQTSMNVTLYVHSMDIVRNTLYVTDNREDLKVDYFKIENVNLYIEDIKELIAGTVQIRYNSRAVRIRDIVQEDDKLIIYPENKIESVTPGQSAVFYSKDNELLGGGVIVKQTR
jgi:tRNA-specific 2-thiouridylase